jgi:uncharacterized protein YfkK (UPF0435 family)
MEKIQSELSHLKNKFSRKNEEDKFKLINTKLDDLERKLVFAIELEQDNKECLSNIYKLIKTQHSPQTSI